MKIIPIKLDRERHIRINYNAIRFFESKTGHSIAAIQENPSFTDMISLLHAGLLWEDKEITIETLCDLMDEYGDIEELQIKLADGLNDLFKRKNS